MHVMSARNRSEFLAVPELVRFSITLNGQGTEGCLLIKTSTLTLKYLATLRHFSITIFRLGGGQLGYGVQVPDDPQAPGTLWSLVGFADELDALEMCLSQASTFVYLYNELAINVAWGSASLRNSIVLGDKTSIVLHPNQIPTFADEVNATLERLKSGGPAASACAFGLVKIAEWHPIKSTLITQNMTASTLNLFDKDEGGQQEQAAVWLLDTLGFAEAIRSPVVDEPSAPRELTDILLNYEHGPFLFESKSLTILSRPRLPDRPKLTGDIVKHVRKAVGQLGGGLKNIRAGLKVTDRSGSEIDISPNLTAHGIVLVPDLSLLDDVDELGKSLLNDFKSRWNSFLHILDPAELLRVVQAAEMIESKGTKVTRLMCFDYYLQQRYGAATQQQTAHFSFLLREKA